MPQWVSTFKRSCNSSWCKNEKPAAESPSVGAVIHGAHYGCFRPPSRDGCVHSAWSFWRESPPLPGHCSSAPRLLVPYSSTKSSFIPLLPDCLSCPRWARLSSLSSLSPLLLPSVLSRVFHWALPSTVISPLFLLSVGGFLPLPRFHMLRQQGTLTEFIL